MKKKEEKQTKQTEEQEVSTFKLFWRAFRETHAFKSLIKLCLYFVMFFIIIIVVALSQTDDKESDYNENDEAPSTTVVAKSYRELLDDLLNSNAKFSYVVTDTEEKSYYISYEIVDGIESGLIETENESLKKFIIRDNVVYEVVLNEERENDKLFQSLNLNYINIYSLVDILTNSKSYKMLEDDYTLYKYEIDGVNISVSVKEERIEKLEINDASIKYDIEIK